MIHTIISEDIGKLDIEVNKFMKAMEKNLPVRTEVFSQDGKLLHKATIFYDEEFKSLPKQDDSGWDEPQEPEKPKTNPDKLGALWLQKDGTVSGTFNEERKVIPETTATKLKVLKEGEHLDLKVNEIPCVIMRNKFKSSAKQPDWVILKRKEK